MPSTRVHKLLLSDDGVALTSTPTRRMLSRTITVIDNLGRHVAWSAHADQTWLTVTATGRADGPLVVTANPAGLAADRTYYATVTLSSPDKSVHSAESLRVGLWVGSVAPAATVSLPEKYDVIVADPIRPYAYVHTHATDVTVYNVYTAKVVATIHSVAQQLGDIVVSTDGSRLFAADDKTLTIVPVNLDTNVVGAAWSTSSDIPVPLHLAYARTNGKRLVMADNGGAYDAATGSEAKVRLVDGYYGDSLLSASKDGSRLCLLEIYIGPYNLACHTLDFDDVLGKVVLGTGVSIYDDQGGGNAQDVAVNPDGTLAYVAAGAPYHITVYDATQSNLPRVQTLEVGDGYPNNVETAFDGRILASGQTYFGPKDVWVYSPSGTLLQDYHLSGYDHILVPRALKISGDGLRLLALTDDPSLQMVDAPSL